MSKLDHTFLQIVSNKNIFFKRSDIESISKLEQKKILMIHLPWILEDNLNFMNNSKIEIC